MIDERTDASWSRHRLTAMDIAKNAKGMIDRGQDDASHDYMRRKLWCDVVMTSMQSKVYDDHIKAADIVLKEFDQRFGKGEGE